MRLISWVRRAIAAAVVAFGLAAGTLVVNGLAEDVSHSDVAVVLGSKVFPDGRPSPRLAARLDRAVALHRDGWVKTVIVSGGTGQEGVPEGDAMKRYLVAQGVPEAAILTDNAGVDTMATARNTAALMRTHDFDRAIVVSQYFHLPRTRLAFRKQGLATVGAAHPDYFEWRDLYSIAREVPGYASYLIR